MRAHIGHCDSILNYLHSLKSYKMSRNHMIKSHIKHLPPLTSPPPTKPWDVNCYIFLTLSIWLISPNFTLLWHVVRASPLEHKIALITTLNKSLCQLQIGTCHLPLQGLNHVPLQLLNFQPLKEVHCEDLRHCVHWEKLAKQFFRYIPWGADFMSPILASPDN